MVCEACGSPVPSPSEAAIPLERAAKRPAFLDYWADELQEAYGVPVSRMHLGRIAELLEGHVALCPGCCARMTVPNPAAVTRPRPPAEVPSHEGDEPPADAPSPEDCLPHLTSDDPEAQARAVGWLVYWGERSVSPLLGWLPSCEGDRSAGLQALSCLRAEEATPALVRIFADGTPDEQTEAEGGLAALGLRGLPAFEAALAPESDLVTDQRRALLVVLGRLGGAASAIVARYLQDPLPELRRAAFAALALRPDPVSIPGVSQLIRDPVREIRKSACALLGRMGHADAVPPLVEALNDPSQEVRTAAAWALARLGFPLPEAPVMEVLRKRGELWLYAALLQLVLA